MAVAPLHAARKEWSPRLFSFVWSNPANWSPAGVPQDGDSLFFEASVLVDGSTHTINDLTNLTVNSLSFRVVNNDAPTTYSWTLSGNELTITRTIETGFSLDEDVYIRCPLRLGGNAQFQAGEGSEFFPYVGLHLDSPIDLNGHSLLLVEHYDGGDLDVSGVISGNGNLHIIGDVELEGENGNTFNGTVFLHDNFDLGAAELTLDKISGPAIPGPLIISNGCVVKLQRPNQIADTTTVVIHPGGALRLDGHPDTVSGLYLRADSSGTPLVDSGGAALSVTDNITALNTHPTATSNIRGQLGLPPGSHVIHTSGSQDFALRIEAQIVGEGGITKQGDKGLILSGNNSFAGDIVIQQGLVHVNHANALGAPSGAAILEGGELEVRDTAIGNKTLWVNRRSDRIPELGGILNVLGACSWAGPIVLNTNLAVSGGNMSFFGPMSGTAGLRLIFNTFVGLTGPEANTYTGPTWADAAVLELNKPAGVTAFRGPLIVDSGSGAPAEVRWGQNYQCVGADVTLFPGALINLNNQREDFGPITFHGGTVSTGTGELGIYGLVTVNASPASALISGRLGLPPGLHEFRVSEGSAFPDLRIDATVLGAGHLRKTGPGQMWLAAANTYNGLTTVVEGALSVLDPNGLGAAATGTTVQEGATLELNFVGTLPEPLALRGGGVSGQGALGVFGDVTLRNPLPSIYAPVDLTADATIGVAPNSFLTMDGFISGIGALHKRGPGTLRFGGNDHNTYVGDTCIDEGIFIMAKPTGTTAVPGALSIGTSAGLPAMAGNVASYQVIGNIFVNRGGLLNLNGQVENVDHLWLTEGGDVQTTSGVLFLKTGGSIQVVPGAVGELSTIAGNLDMDAGDHVINVGGNSSSGLASAVQLEISALLTSSLGGVNLQKTGPGILRLTADNTYSGPTIINAGVLQVDGSQPGSAISVLNGGQLAGHGRTGGINYLTTGMGSRVVAPGDAPGRSPGILSCSGFNSAGAGGVLQVDLNGTAPGSTGHDQLHAVGRFASVRLDGVALDATLNFASAINDQFIIILNDGIRTAVIGEFTGLPEGAHFYIGGEQFAITYTGGDGNDVVLTRLPTPPRPALTIERVAPSAVRVFWPASFNDYSLQSTTNLSLANWTAAMPLPVVTGTNNVMTNATSPGSKFYRLFKP